MAGPKKISVTDQEGKNLFGKICGELDTRFLNGANFESNKPYLKAVHKILQQLDPENIQINREELQ